MDLPGSLSYRVERLKFKATNLDLGLALIATFLLPIACWLLLDWSGALLPLILYYGVFCVAIVLWRKKNLDYVRPSVGPSSSSLGCWASRSSSRRSPT